MRVQLVRLVRLVHDGKRDTETQPFQVPHFLGQSYGFRGKVHLEFKCGGMASSLTRDVENLALNYLLP